MPPETACKGPVKRTHHAPSCSSIDQCHVTFHLPSLYSDPRDCSNQYSPSSALLSTGSLLWAKLQVSRKPILSVTDIELDTPYEYSSFGHPVLILARNTTRDITFFNFRGLLSFCQDENRKSILLSKAAGLLTVPYSSTNRHEYRLSCIGTLTTTSYSIKSLTTDE